MNFGELKAAIARWLARSDLSADIPIFVQLAEARLARDVRIGALIATATVTIAPGASSAALPVNYAAGVGVSAVGGYTYASPGVFADLVAAGNADRVYTISGGSLSIPSAATSEVALSVTYYAKPAALSADADTNQLLTNHPALYLYCALAEASVAVADDDRAALWEAKYRKELEDVRSANWGADYFNVEQYAQSVA